MEVLSYNGYMDKIIIIAFDSLLIGLMLTTLIIKKNREHFLPQKMLCSLFFLCASVYCMMEGKSFDRFLYLFPGFLLCFFGDAFLGLYNRNWNKKTFLMGVLLFLLGHIAFIIAAYREIGFMIVDPVFPVLALIYACYIMKKKEMTMGRLKPYCLLYTFFVALMFTKNLEMLILMPSIRTTLLAVGALLFLISDYLILYLYFVKKRRWATHGINLATYYYGVLCMVLSLLY